MKLELKGNNFKQVLLIDNEGVNLGIISLEEALYKADSIGLDLVKVKDSDPVVCKIMDYSKYKFNMQKKSKISKDVKKKVKQKEIKFNANIGDNDLAIKINNVKRLLVKGYKVKVTLVLKGRESSNKSFFLNKIIFFKESCSEFTLYKDIFYEGNKISIELEG